MGLELHITRAEFWASNEGAEISAQEWRDYVEKDHELRLDPQHGQYFAIWLRKSKYAEPWLDWSRGNISTKWPDTALYRKMLIIAADLGATVQDDDGNLYVSKSDWMFDPTKQ